MDKIELIKKLKKLADDDRGNDNERISAETRLNELMIKYHIKIEDIIMDQVKERCIPFETEYEKRLIHQIAYKLWKRDKSIMSYTNKRKKFNRIHIGEILKKKWIYFIWHLYPKIEYIQN